MKPDEIRATTARLIERQPEVERQLRRIPSVRGVGVGARERAGQPTGEVVFRVYVERKRPLAEVPAAEIVPRKILGFDTDVHTMLVATPHCRSRVLLAGLQVANDAVETGTLGCFLTMPDGHTVILTNDHVFRSGRGRTDYKVYQPLNEGNPDLSIGVSLPEHGTVALDASSNYIDCAVATIAGKNYQNLLVSFNNRESDAERVTTPNVPGSVFRNSKGQVSEIRNAGDQPIDTTKILGSATAQPNSLVWKVGAATELTAGYVADVNASITFGPQDYPPLLTFEAQHVVIVNPIAGYLDPATKKEMFAKEGDSGAVYLDLDNKVVAHHHHGVGVAGDPGAQFTPNGAGTHIAAVLAHLGGAKVLDHNGTTVTATAARSTVLAGAYWAAAPAAAHDLDRLARDLRARLDRSARGREVGRLMEEHGREVLDLVGGRRAVTAVWHRHHGPAFLALFARALAEPEGSFPVEVEGVSRGALLAAMADVLIRAGGADLAADIARERPRLLGLLASCRDVRELVAGVAEEAA